MRDLARKPFASALLGGLVVAIFGWIAIEAGWIEAEVDEGPAFSGSPRLSNPSGENGDGDGLTVAEIYNRTRGGVVNVTARVSRQAESPFGDPFGERQEGLSSGSGFAIDDKGRILTNAHVVNGATQIEVKVGNREYAAELIGQDVSSDLALIRARSGEDRLDPIPLGDSSKVEVGDPVVAIGNPFGLDNTVTTGIVSALQRRIEAPNGFTISDVIQTDASINPGNSGGPLIDATGRVIGINSQIATAGGGSVGIGFAVPSSTARKVVRELEDDGRVRRAYLGISGATISEELAEAFNLSTRRGVLVQSVVEDGPADEAGLRAGRTTVTVDGAELVIGGDIIVEIAGRRVTSMEQIVDAVDRRKPGDEIEIVVVRRGDRRTLRAELGERPQRLDRQSSLEGNSPFGE